MEEVTVMRTFVICKSRSKLALVHAIEGCREWRQSFIHPQLRPLPHAPAALSPAIGLLVPIEWKIEWVEDLVCYSQYPCMLIFLK